MKSLILRIMVLYTVLTLASAPLTTTIKATTAGAPTTAGAAYGHPQETIPPTLTLPLWWPNSSGDLLDTRHQENEQPTPASPTPSAQSPSQAPQSVEVEETITEARDPYMENITSVSPQRAPLASTQTLDADYVYTDTTGLADLNSYPCSSPAVLTLSVSDTFTVGDVDVGINLNHSLRGHISITLQSPAGTRVQLIEDPDIADRGLNYDLLVDDVSFSPRDDGDRDDTRPPYYERSVAPVILFPNAGGLHTFEGENAQGTWQLWVCDQNAGNGYGTLVQWSLFFREPAPEFAWTTQKSAPYKVEPGDTFNYALYINNSGSLSATHVLISDTLPPGIVQKEPAICSPSSGATLSSTHLTNPITCLGSIPPQGAIAVLIPVTVTADANQTITNSFSISAPTLADQVVFADTTRVYTSGTLHYYEGFNMWTITSRDDSAANGWNAGGQWATRLFSAIGPPSSHSGLVVLGTNLQGPYDDGTTSVLTGVLNLTGIPAAHAVTLQWWEWLDLAPGDYAFVELASTRYPTPTLFYGSYSSLTQEQATHKKHWSEVQRDVTRYRGQVITLTFTLDPNNDGSTAAGWYVDDVGLHTAPGRPSFEESYKEAGNWVMYSGSPFTYLLSIRNSGSGTSSDGHMFDRLPEGLEVDQATLDGTGVLTYGLDWIAWKSTPTTTLSPGEAATVAVHTRLPWSAACGALLTNSMRISDSQGTGETLAQAMLAVSSQIYERWDLEADEGGFGVANGEWEWGAPDPVYPPGPTYAHSGRYVWGVDLDGDSRGDWVHYLTRTLDLPDNPRGLYLRWWDWYDQDIGDVRRLRVNGTQVWRGATDTDQPYWASQVVDLTPWAGETVQLTFELDIGGLPPNPAGWYIDDIVLYAGCPHIEIAPAVAGVTCPGSEIDYALTVKNASSRDGFLNLALDPEAEAWSAQLNLYESFFETGQTQEVTLSVAVPWTVPAGARDTLTLSAKMVESSWLTGQAHIATTAGLGSGWGSIAPTLQGTRFHDVAYQGGYVYQVGGEASLWTPTDAVQRYDIAANTWTARAALLTPTSGIDVVALGGRLYVPGGNDDHDTPLDGGSFLDALQIYSPTIDSWSLGAPLPTSLAHASAAAHEGLLYVMGGLSDGGAYLDTLYIYDPASDSWSQGALMNQARAYARAEVIGGEIYVAGGSSDEGTRDSLEIYDPQTGDWRFGPDLPQPLTFHGAGVLDDRYLLLWGGDDTNYTCSFNAWTLDTQTGHWFSLPSLSRCLYGSQGAGDGTTYYLISGRTNEGGWHMATESERLTRCAVPPAATWDKKIGGQTWTSGFTRSVAIGDRLEVVDRLSATQVLTLSERWDPDQLELFTYTLDPPGDSSLILQGAWRLEAEAPFAYARTDAEYAYATGLVYILGGRVSSGNDVGRIWAFDPRTGVYTDTGIDMPQAVSNYEIARLVDNEGREVMLTFGGYLDESSSFTDLVQGYYPASNSVVVFGSDPLPVKAIPGGVAVVDNKAYVFGGTDGPTALNETYIFDITSPAGSRWSVGPDLNLARRYIPNAVVDGVIYALGGDIIGGLGLVPVILTEKLDTGSGSPAWDDAGVAAMPVACDEAPAFGFDSTLTHTLAGSVVIAGCGHWSDESALSLRYDTQRDTWDQTFPPLNMARRNHAGALVPSPTANASHDVPAMWVWGGRADNDANVLTQPERYAPARLNWSATASASGPLTLTKHFTVAACTWSKALLDEQVWIAGKHLERRGIRLQKPEADLEIGGIYEREVGGGQTITFTLRYTNTSSREPDVEILADFPGGTHFIEAARSPQEWDSSDGGWARWKIDWLAADEAEAWIITMAISEGVSIGAALPVNLSIYDHADTLHAVATLDFTVICQGLTGISLQPLTPGTLYIGTPLTLSADLVPDGFTRPYTYTLNFDDGLPPIGSQSGEDPLVVTRTYATTGTYDVQIWAWNCTIAPHEALSDRLPLTLYTPGTCVPPSGVSIEGAERGQPGSLPGIYTFNATYTPWDTTLPIRYAWDSGEDSVQVTRTLGIGIHTLAVTVTNDCGQVTTTHGITVSPCISVNSVDLSVTSLGTVYTSTIVELRALISPTEATPPYQYIFDGEPVGTIDQNTLAFTHTFSITGTHRVETRAWNCSMDQSQAASDAVTITVQEQGGCVGLNVLDIHGAESGDPGRYTFTTTYQPQDATLPLGYLWDNEAMGDKITRRLDEGHHTLVVTATNACSQVTATHSITINAAPVCTQVTGVDLAVASAGTVYTDTVVTFTARLGPDDAGMPYTYTINGGSAHIGTAKPLVFAQTFPTTGTHTVEIAVWNCAMSQADAVTDSHTITISAASVCTQVTEVKLDVISAGTFYTDTLVSFSADIVPNDADKPYTYTLDYGTGPGDPDTNHSDPLTAINHTFPTTGTHTVEIAVWNCAMPPSAAITDQVSVTVEARDLSLTRIYLPLVLRQ